MTIISILFLINFAGLYLSSAEALDGLTELNRINQLNSRIRILRELSASLVDSIKKKSSESSAVFESVKNQVDAIFKDFSPSDNSNSELRDLLLRIRERLDQVKEVGRIGLAENSPSKMDALVIDQLSLETQDLLNRTHLLLTSMADQTFQSIYQVRFQPLIAGIVLTLMFLFFVVSKGLQLHNHFQKSINNLLTATTAVSGGDLSHTASIVTPDEIGRLTDAFNQMIQALRESTVSREALIQANKGLEAFSYSVSHDLRSPLRTVDGFSLALLEDCGDKLDEEGKRYITRIRKAIQKMGRLIDDILDLSRLSRAEMTITKVDLSAYVRTLAKELKDDEPQRSVEFKIQNDLEVMADASLIKVALQNLLSNAWKYTSKHPHACIEFGSTNMNGELTYYVRDDGAGFDMTYINKLFGPFQRLHKESDFPGTGVGLATVHRIITRHNGKLWATSEIEKGATFYFTL